MKFYSPYFSYKRDTRVLLRWIIKTSNDIKKYSLALEINVTGQVTVSNLVPLSELIAKDETDIPSTIYHLFLSVIKLRSISYSQYQQLAVAFPSEELERNNSNHKYFIDALTSAFEVLGGEEWLSEEQEKRTNNDKEKGSDANTFAFTNKFSVLDLESDPENDDALDANSEESDKDSAPQKKKQKSRKGRKKGKGKKSQRFRRSSQSNGIVLDDIPLDQYRIIEDNNMTEYAMAMFALTRDMIQLRSFLQDIWRKVAYKNLNSAVAATASNIAVAMIKQSEAAIFIDFPGYESFEMVKQTITQGDIEKAESRYQLTTLTTGIKGSSNATKTLLDIRELFFIHTYHDLVDFITDYQKTRSGKPTKRMLAQIDKWSPNLDLQRATKEERIKWRRSYTINWLYDLVNITACVAIHGKYAKNENYVFEQMDWSDQGPLKSHRRMFGLINFAAKVTKLAMQKPGIDFRHKIPPHLVFHLQCIMDAWTVSRGWAISGVKGHVLAEPAQNFRPRRDLDDFLGWESMEKWTPALFKGYFTAVNTLKVYFTRLKNDGRDFEYTKGCIEFLEKLGLNFLDTLGKCEVFHNLSAFLPSRFAATNPNGAWDYSPFFCGAGLAEGLELLYRSIMTLWDGMWEPILILHLHNMLVQRGYLKQAIPLYSGLGMIFSDSFFSGGQPPTDDYVEAFRSQFSKGYSRRAILRERMSLRTGGKVINAHDFLNNSPLHLFKQKSGLLIYRLADWDPDRVPDSDIDPMSALGMIRLSQTRRVRDPVTLAWRLEETDLVKKTRAAGIDESSIVSLGPIFERLRDERQAQVAQMTLCIPDYPSTQLSWLYNANKGSKKEGNNVGTSEYGMTAEEMLSILYNDVYGDIYGGLRSLSGLSYIWITVHMLRYFEELESESRNSSKGPFKFVFADDIESNVLCRNNRRLSTTVRALGGQDKELLKSMAKVFERCGGRFLDYLYWSNEDDEAKTSNGPVVEDGGLECYVM